MHARLDYSAARVAYAAGPRPRERERVQGPAWAEGPDVDPPSSPGAGGGGRGGVRERTKLHISVAGHSGHIDPGRRWLKGSYSFIGAPARHGGRPPA